MKKKKSLFDGGYWNYRVIKRISCGEEVYGVHEVFYNSKGRIELWTEGSVDVVGCSIADVKAQYDSMAEAFTKPVLVVKNKKLVEIEQGKG